MIRLMMKTLRACRQQALRFDPLQRDTELNEYGLTPGAKALLSIQVSRWKDNCAGVVLCVAIFVGAKLSPLPWWGEVIAWVIIFVGVWLNGLRTLTATYEMQRKISALQAGHVDSDPRPKSVFPDTAEELIRKMKGF